MNGRYLLDTHIIIALLAQEASLRTRFAQAQDVYVPCIALGELYYGALKSGRVAQNLAKLDEFAASSSVLSCSAETAREYGTIKSELRARFGELYGLSSRSISATNSAGFVTL